MSPEQWLATQGQKPLSPEEWLAMQPAQPKPSVRADMEQMLTNMTGDPMRGESFLAGLGQGVGNVALGAQNIAGKVLDFVGADRIGQAMQRDAAQGKERLAGQVSPYAEQYPMSSGGGKLAGEIAATLPVGGVLAKGASMVPGVSQSLVNSLRSSGFTTGGAGGMGARIAGGAATGGASAALVNPEEAGTGATIGGALPVVGSALSKAMPLVATAIGGTTGAGDEALKQAFAAGKQGGQAAQSFTQNLRGTGQMDDVLTMAKQNLQAMGQQKRDAYRAGMANVKADKSVLDFANIDKSLDDAMGMATFKGQIKNEKAAQALSEAKGVIDEWKSLDPMQFHTPEGLDALKQRVGGILESIPFEQKTARTAVGQVYDSLRGEISKQAPEYSRVMKDYSEATETIREIEKALSLGQKSSADTAMRKLQSLMRNNVNTNYGQRMQLAEQLRQSGGQDFMPALAGQSLSAVLPRGIQSALTGTGGAGLAITGNVPAAAALGAVSSPRLMGEAFYGAGKAAGVVNPAVVEALRKGTYRASPVIGSQSGQ